MKPDIPIKKKEIVLDMSISALFSGILIALLMNPHLLAIYQRGVEPIPMLIASSARNLIFGFLPFSLLAFSVSLVKLTKKQWSVALAWASSISELSGALYFAFFMTRWNALNTEFVRFFRNDLRTWQIIARASVLCFVLLTLISMFDDLYKVYGHKKMI